jgi:hypothetical protein
MTPRPADDKLRRQLEIALDVAEDDRIKYHLREALQLQLTADELEHTDEIEQR